MSDGTVVRGVGGGAPGLAVGELVFQTGMVGYQEALTDPSYAGQILIFTYPLVGNYGVGDLANQSARVHPRAIISHRLMAGSGHRSTTHDLDEMLRAQGVPALHAVDTRFLTRRVRTHGVVPAALAVGPDAELPGEEELRALAASLDYDQTDFVAECSTRELVWHPPANPDSPRVALVDYGYKRAMLDHLLNMGAGVWLVPATMSAAEIMALRPDGVLLSNGPGDPSRLDYAVETVRGLLDRAGVPVFGICLGHQLLALAGGGSTSKMRFGHRGINQPVLEVATGRVSITTQNHGYMVDPDSIPAGYVVTHTNLNDGSVEGIAHASLPVWGVQWHPEAHPGPVETQRLFERFLGAMEVAHA
jgi:carbamoyl-phosphate synthase small subunit